MNNELNRELIKACWEVENFDPEIVKNLLIKGADINFRWDVHSYNPEDISPEDIKLCEGGVLFKVPDPRMGGNVDPSTGEMYRGDRVCPLDISLGYVGDGDEGEQNLALLKILIEHNVDYVSAHAYTNYRKDDLRLIAELHSQFLDKTLPKNHQKPLPKNKI